jgi:hypothetical protein
MNTEEQERGLEILNISVDIGDGNHDILNIHEHDDLSFVIRKFFIKNNISNRSEKLLIEKIEEILQETSDEHEIINKTLANSPNLPTRPCRNYGEKLYLKGLIDREEFLVVNQIKRIQAAKEIDKTLQDKPLIDKNSKKIVNDLTVKSISALKILTPKTSTATDFFSTFTPNLKTERLSQKTSKYVDTLLKNPKKSKKVLEKNEKTTRKSDLSLKSMIKHKVSPSNPVELTHKLINPESSLNHKPETQLNKFIPYRTSSTGHSNLKINTEMQSDAFKSKLTEPKSCSGRLDPFLAYPYNLVKLKGKSQHEKILAKKKIDRLLTIFNKLNPNPNGEISCKDIVFNKLDKNIVNIMMPLFDTMAQTGLPLVFEEFVDRMEDLVKNLTPTDKKIILDYKTGKKGIKPGINYSIDMRKSKTQEKLTTKPEKPKKKSLKGHKSNLQIPKLKVNP